MFIKGGKKRNKKLKYSEIKMQIGEWRKTEKSSFDEQCNKYFVLKIVLTYCEKQLVK